MSRGHLRDRVLLGKPLVVVLGVHHVVPLTAEVLSDVILGFLGHRGVLVHETPDILGSVSLLESHTRLVEAVIAGAREGALRRALVAEGGGSSIIAKREG
jgi:hypothetical protein